MPTDEGWASAIRDHRFEVGGGKRASFTLTGGAAFGEDCRLELVPDGRTRIAITDQIADLGGADESAEREKGWRDILDRRGSLWPRRRG